MGCEHDSGSRRHVVELFDEHRPLGLEVPDHVDVVDDLAAHVDRRAETLQGPLDDLDRPLHPGAERAWGGQDHLATAHRGGPALERWPHPRGASPPPAARPGPSRGSRCRPPSGRRPGGAHGGARPARPTPCRPARAPVAPSAARRPPRTSVGEETTGPVTTSRPGLPQLGRQQLRPGKRPDHGSVGVAELGRHDQLSGHEVRVEAAAHPDDRHRRIVGQGRRQRDPLGPGLGPPSPAHLDSATDRQRLDPQGGHHHELSHGHSPGGSGPAP